MKPKKIIIPSAAGFVLSFLISIIATHRFGVSLLRALIFAVVFAALAVGVMFLSEHMLDTGDSLSDSVPSGGSSSSSAQGVANRAQRGGGAVDITIDDEMLTDDRAGPLFNVSSNKMPLGGASAAGDSAGSGVLHSRSVKSASAAGGSSGNVSSATEVESRASGSESPSSGKEAFSGGGGLSAGDTDPADTASAANSKVSSASQTVAQNEGSSFRPIALGTGGGGTGGEVKASKGEKPLTAKEQELAERKARHEAELREIDSLPSLDGISAGFEEGNSEIIQDSDFASGDSAGSESTRTSLVDGEKALSQNTEIMAKAIQTLLKKDS